MNPQIPGFLIQREVGKGGMGVVYQAIREHDQKRVAIKLLPSHFANPTTARRFQREGRSLLSIQHPNIVQVFDVNCHEGTHYIVMEFLEGRPLSQVLRLSSRGLPLDLARQLAKDIGSALQVIHEKGLIHRDLKPGNVVVGEDGRAKLLDFGLVQIEGLTMLTETGSLLGTPLYMSPEQCAGLPADHRSDIYSFGIVLFQMLTGHVPFQSESVYELLEKHKNEAPESPRKIRKEVPADLEQIALRCLEKKPEARYRNLDELLADFADSSIAPEAPAEGSSPAASLQALTPSRARPLPNRKLRIAAGGLATASLVAALIIVQGDRPLRWMAAQYEAAQRWWESRFSNANAAESEPQLEQEVQEQFALVRRAESLFEKGERQRTDMDLHGAYQSFEEAWEVYPHVRYLEALLKVGHALRRYEDGERVLNEAIRLNPSIDEDGRLRELIRGHR